MTSRWVFIPSSYSNKMCIRDRVAILDADKEGFLRSETSLIQTIGRAARNAQGKVILYADSVTAAMDAALRETERRRSIQDAYNQAHGIVPKTIIKSVRDLIEISKSTAEIRRKDGVKMTKAEREMCIRDRFHVLSRSSIK